MYERASLLRLADAQYRVVQADSTKTALNLLPEIIPRNGRAQAHRHAENRGDPTICQEFWGRRQRPHVTPLVAQDAPGKGDHNHCPLNE